MTGRIDLSSYLDAGREPAPSFASDAEIKLAEALRRQLEERYLGSSASPAPTVPNSKQGH